MASSPSLPPPPGSSSGAPPSPTSPTAVSPSPEQSSPAMGAGSALVIQITQNLRAIAKAYPAAAPIVMEMNDLAKNLLPIMMQHQSVGEPAAPPIGS